MTDDKPFMLGACDPAASEPDFRPPGQWTRRSVTWEDVESTHRCSRDRCFRCAVQALCEKAHVIDRSLGGADTPLNLVPLCRNCHGAQPPFSPGEEMLAYAWLTMDADLFVKVFVFIRGRAFLAEEGDGILARNIEESAGKSWVEVLHSGLSGVSDMIAYLWEVSPYEPKQRYNGVIAAAAEKWAAFVGKTEQFAADAAAYEAMRAARAAAE